MYDPIDNKTINWITSLTSKPSLFMGVYQLLDCKLGNKSIDCMTGTTSG